ncbi:MAG: IS200/IS605 family transposase [Flavobacteriales bacterium]|nr:IS200/IS605 family transposase [Flavobacteriales bacterium]
MSQSLTKLYVHIIFHTKYSQPLIRKQDKEKLYAYIGSVLNTNKSTPIKINGIENHIHIFCLLSKNIALSKLVEEIKRHSSRWIKTIDPHYKNFAWQGGYGAFSVCPSKFDAVKKYIENQEEHHKKKDARKEYIQFLEKHQIEFDENYLWTD